MSFEHAVGDAADRVAADLHAVELAPARGDIPPRHAAGVEAKDPIIKTGKPSLALGPELGVKRPGLITRRLELNRPDLGLDRFGR